MSHEILTNVAVTDSELKELIIATSLLTSTLQGDLESIKQSLDSGLLMGDRFDWLEDTRINLRARVATVSALELKLRAAR